jgi:uncharacterized protein (TIGR03067 family)
MQATLLFAALALGAPALKDPPRKEVKLEGEWVVESQTTGGRPLKSKLERRYIFSADGKWTMTTARVKAMAGANVTPKLTRVYSVDKSKDLTTIDMKTSAGLERPTYVGIIKMDGDRLILCYNRGTEERPTKFESLEGTNTVLIVLRRKTE